MRHGIISNRRRAFGTLNACDWRSGVINNNHVGFGKYREMSPGLALAIRGIEQRIGLACARIDKSYDAHRASTPTRNALLRV